MASTPGLHYGIDVMSQSAAASFLSANAGEISDVDEQDSVQVLSRKSFSDWEKVEDTNEDSDIGSFLPVLEAKPKSMPKSNLAVSGDMTRLGSAVGMDTMHLQFLVVKQSNFGRLVFGQTFLLMMIKSIQCFLEV